MSKINTLKQYSDAAGSTKLPSCDNFTYLMLGMVAEVGEVADKVAKWRRKGMAFVKDDHLTFNPSDEYEARMYKDELAKEVGDVLWFVAQLSEYLDVPFAELALRNAAKLAARKSSGTIVEHKDH